MIENKKGFLGAILLFGILFVVISFRFIGGDHVLMTTDAIISGGSRIGIEAVRLFPPSWRDFLLLGLPAAGAMQVPTILKVFVPAIIWNNLTYFFACFLTAIAGMYSLRHRIKTVYGWIFFGISSAWVGSNLTLLYAGHGFKPYVVLFFVCSLIPVGRAAVGSVSASLVWGGCVGLMFAQQPDVALFFAIFSGVYFVFRLWKLQGFKPLKWLKCLVPALVIAFMFAAGPLLSGYQQQVRGAAQMQSEDKQEKWEYVTQWSFPPEETIAFVAPGYTGWRSGEPEGPYWGRMGRSAGWEKTKQGFRNFKLENTYLGLIPMVFAFFALFSCRRSKHKAEILFWGGAMFVALVLAFGKYFPLYSLFYAFPVVNNIRNPNKFLQVFQVCLAILTAYGVDALWRSKGVDSEEGVLNKINRSFFWGMAGLLGLLGFAALILMINQDGDIGRFTAQGWPLDAAKIMVQNKITALWHASFMAALMGGVFAVFSFKKPARLLRFKNWIFAGLVLIVAVDAVKLSKHYVKEMPRSYIDANALTDFLKKDLGQDRVALVSQQGIYSVWLSYLLPYNHIPAFNYSQIGRMPLDYEKLLKAGSKNPLRLWRFSGVKYVLAPSAIERQLPPNQLRKVFAYDLAAAPENGFRVVANPSGAHAVFEFIRPTPRYALVHLAEQENDDQALARIADSRKPLLGENRAAGSIEVLNYRPGRVELEVQADQPCMLRAAERWDPDWKATLNGERVDVQRIDFICQGVELPAGAHRVVLSYSPSLIFFYIQCCGYLVLFAAIVVALRSRHEKD